VSAVRHRTSLSDALVTCAIALAIATAALTPAVAQTKGVQTPSTAAQRRAVLLDPTNPFWKTHAPENFTAEMETSKGMVTMEFTRALAPNGVDHFYNLARAGFYDDTRFFRVVPGFVAQFGLARDPAVESVWGSKTIRADSVRDSNVRGTISFAQFKPTDRSAMLFINMRDNLNLDTLNFAPIGHVVQGMDVVDSLFSGYGEIPMSDPPLGDPKKLFGQTNKWLDARFPKLDRIIKITIK
jgi:cyclophilin family peptidyl-prolyl cis-trans isomerase